MRMTILPAQRIVIIDGQARGPLLLDVAANIHAVQWYGAKGEIEFVDHDGDGPISRPPNERFTDIGRFQSAIDAWSAWTPSTPLVPPGSTVPPEITNFQARAVLMGMPGSAEGRTLFEDVDDTLRAMGGTAWQAWEYANTITRNGVLVQQMAAQFGLTDANLDEMFRQAALVSA